jgi:SWIM zinc finger
MSILSNHFSEIIEEERIRVEYPELFRRPKRTIRLDDPPDKGMFGVTIGLNGLHTTYCVERAPAPADCYFRLEECIPVPDGPAPAVYHVSVNGKATCSCREFKDRGDCPHASGILALTKAEVI